MRRREFIAGLAGAAALPVAAWGQQAGKVARIGYRGLTSPSSHAKYSQAFRDGLRRLGYVEGTNVVIDFRFAEENTDRLPALAAELVRDKVDVIVTYATGVPIAQRTTATIPIVMAIGSFLASRCGNMRPSLTVSQILVSVPSGAAWAT